jgi:beta-glucanase (GH16 family)
MKRAVTLLAILAAALLIEPTMSAQNGKRLGPALDRTGLVKTFGDEFDVFNRNVWIPENFDPEETDNRIRPWARERQFYVDASYRGTSAAPLGLDPFSIRDGVLVITADRTPNNKRRHLAGYRYTSGWLSTLDTFTQKYGYFEARMRVPKGKSFWSAFWLMIPDAWPPEIDVMEVLGRETDRLHVNVHTEETGEHEQVPYAYRTADLSRDFHVYGAEWGPKDIVFYLDDREIYRTRTPRDLHEPGYLILNLALGGSWAKDPDLSTPFPAHLEIDWVRVWRREAAAR